MEASGLEARGVRRLAHHDADLKNPIVRIEAGIDACRMPSRLHPCTHHLSANLVHIVLGALYFVVA